MVKLAPGEARVVAFLALAGRPVRREALADRLWAEADPAHGAASLRSALWRLGKILPALVRADRTHVALGEAVVVDADDARAMARRAVDDPEFAARASIAALEVDVLPEFYEDWAIVEHERYRQQRLHALEAVARACAGKGLWGRAIDAAGTAIAAEPLRESAHRVLVELHLAEGNLDEARRSYERCRDLLAAELGVAPSRRFEELVAAAAPPAALTA